MMKLCIVAVLSTIKNRHYSVNLRIAFIQYITIKQITLHYIELFYNLSKI